MEKSYDWVSVGYLKLTQVFNRFDRRIIDRIVNSVGVCTVVFSKVLAIFDREVIDGLVNFAGWISKTVGAMLTGIQSGKIQNQLVWLLVLLITIILWFQF